MKYKETLESIGITFVATFLLTISVLVGAEDFAFSKASIVAVIGAGVIAGTRAIAKSIYFIAKELLQDGNKIDTI